MTDAELRELLDFHRAGMLPTETLYVRLFEASVDPAQIRKVTTEPPKERMTAVACLFIIAAVIALLWIICTR